MLTLREVRKLAALVAIGYLGGGCDSAPEVGDQSLAVLVVPPDSAFAPFRCDGAPASDAAGDSPGNEDVDIVGDATFPAMYRALDASFLYLRMRLNATPTAAAGDLDPKNWGFLLDTDDDFTSFEFLINANGNPTGDSVTWEQNVVQSPPNDPGDGTRTVLATYVPAVDHWHAKPTGDGSAFGGDDDHFLTVVIRTSDLAAASISLTDPIGLWAATANNNVNFRADLSCDGRAGTLDGNETTVDPLDPACLIDTDGDGVCDPIDPCPLDNPDDTDGDGACDSADPCPVDPANDSDGDGVCDSADPCPQDNPDDTDGDGVCDSADPCPQDDPDDTDGDGVCDSDDPCPQDDPDDSDGDGVCDANDACPGEDDAVDADSDGLPDACDVCPADAANDADGDGRCADADNCPSVANPGQEDGDGDGIGDVCECAAGDDADGDNVCNGNDNCAEVSNPGQDDADGDGLGDACDPCPADPENDTDDDGVCGDIDSCDADPDNDADGDGLCGDVDNCADDANQDQDDADGDGIGDECDACDDADGDGACDDRDNCDVENADQDDLDGDGLGDACDTDTDGNGIADDLGVSGGGCAIGPGRGSGATLLLALLLVPLALRRRRRRGPARWLVAAVVVVIGAAEANAQTADIRDFPVERFRLASDHDGIFNVESGQVLPHRGWSFAAWISHADDPLIVYDAADPDQPRLGSLVKSRTGGTIAGHVGLWNRLQLGAEAPVILHQKSDGQIDGVEMPGDLSAGGLGDLRLAAKVGLLSPTSPVGVALVAGMTLPTASSDDYMGEQSVSFSPEVAVSGRVAGLRAALDVGMTFRDQTEIENLSVEHEIFVRLGAAYSATHALDLGLTLAEATALDDPLGRANQGALEGLGGATYQIVPAAAAFAGVGFGLNEGFGTPDWRLVAGVRFGTPRDRDTDEDGIVDHEDGCPLVAEDRDGFQDLDGCPELDNDRDDVVDTSDGAPNDPEDRDGFQDEDGVPDPDDDGDGIADLQDQCRREPETKNGYQDDDGCPDEEDPDGDGIRGKADNCPQDPEDLDQFTDEDGCPDPNNDGDELPDTADRCPNQAGPVENRGCPDQDRDRDGVVDRLDNCPDEKGDFDNHGCVKKQLVHITRTKLVIADRVWFASGKAKLMRRSNRLLDNVAAVLAVHPEISLVIVEGHTDDRGGDAFNLDLSNRRAQEVVAYLVRRGIAAERLTAKGFGEQNPIAPNKTRAGRSANRRVEFMIPAIEAPAVPPPAPATP